MSLEDSMYSILRWEMVEEYMVIPKDHRWNCMVHGQVFRPKHEYVWVESCQSAEQYDLVPKDHLRSVPGNLIVYECRISCFFYRFTATGAFDVEEFLGRVHFFVNVRESRVLFVYGDYGFTRIELLLGKFEFVAVGNAFQGRTHTV